MTHPLVWLALRGYRNQVARRLKSLRRPRTLFALAIGVAYFIFVLRQPRPLAQAIAAPDAVALALSVIVMLVVGWAWIGPLGASPIALTPAELFYLVPAPVPQPTLVLYKLARWQLPLLFNALVLTVVLSSRSDPISGLRRVLAVWLLLTTFRLHRLLAMLVRTHPRQAVRGFAMPAAIVLFGAYLCALAIAARHAVPGDVHMLLSRIRELPALLAGDPVARALLRPLQALVLPIALSRAGGQWAIYIAAPVLVVVLHVWLVVHAPHVLDDADAGAIDSQSRRSALAARPRSRILLPIASSGVAAWAITWRQLAPFVRLNRVRTMAIAAFVGITAVRLLPSFGLQAPYDVIAMALILWTALVIATGPLWMRFGIRRELDQIDRLRALPLGPVAVVVAFVATSWIATTAVQAGMLGLVALILTGPHLAEFDVDGIRQMLPWIAASVPIVTAAGAVVCELGAIWFPEWVRPPLKRGAGIDVLGANLLTLVGYLLGLATVLLLPGSIAAGLLWLVPGHAMLALVGFWIGTAATLMGLVRIGARSFSRMEPIALAGLT